MSHSDLFESEILKLLLGKAAALSYPITPYMALFTTIPDETGNNGVQVSGGGYARQAVTSKFPTPTNGTIANSAEIDFGTATAAWGTIVGFGIYTSASGGQLLFTGTVTPSVNVVNGQPVVIPVGAATITQD